METRTIQLTMQDSHWKEVDRLSEHGDLERTIRSLIVRGLGVNNWSNPGALGYAILAAKRLEYSEDQTKELVRAMYRVFDEKTVEEAEEAYAKFN